MIEDTAGWTTWCDVNIRSDRDGTLVRVKADPRIETLTSKLGEGVCDTLEAYGRSWVSANTAVPLSVYKYAKPLEVFQPDGRGCPYTLKTVGGAFEDDAGLINLSFLRIKGVSGADGITFRVTHPIGLPKAKRLKQLILDAVRQFVLDHLISYQLSFKLVSKEY